MASISVIDLLLPAAREPAYLAGGAAAGVAFVLAAAAWLHRDGGPADTHAHSHAVPDGTLSATSLLVFLVFTVHSAPEGVGIGSALREGTTLGLIVVGAIALHNVPEGTAVAVGMRADDVPLHRAFLGAVATSLPQPLLAPVVFLVAVGPWLEAGMGFAGGAMLALIAREVVPAGRDEDPGTFAAGAAVGLAVGIGLNLLVPVSPGL